MKMMMMMMDVISSAVIQANLPKLFFKAIINKELSEFYAHLMAKAILFCVWFSDEFIFLKELR